MIKALPPHEYRLEYTGERFVPGHDRDSEALHFHRYLAASSLVDKKTVLDIACGEGFGAWFLAQRAAHVIGVDISQQSISHASERYKHPRLEFKCGDCRAIPLESDSVDLVVSFETLEHIHEHAEFLAEIRRVLKPGGVLLISTPEMDAYDAGRVVPNEYHALELSRHDFAALLQAQFANVALYDQGIKLASVIWPRPLSNETTADVAGLQDHPWWREVKEGAYQERDLHDAVIVIAAASDSSIENLRLGGFLQAFPHQFPISAIEGGLEERIREAQEDARTAADERIREVQEEARTAVRIRLLEAEAMLKEIREKRANELFAGPPRTATSSVPFYTPAGDINARMARYERKLNQYAVLERISFFGPQFQKNMVRKREKYQGRIRNKALHPAPESGLPLNLNPLEPLPLSDWDRLILAFGPARLAGPLKGGACVVSIVIPVFNQVAYTLACLRSLAIHQTRYAFEVIVVDDCSNDTTGQEMQNIGWVRYLRQGQNGGFIASCNSGLEIAQGDYVLFLNNDTEVLPGWLDELVETFTNFPQVGLVGSKLIYPDGQLQESGGIIWRDGSAWNYGRGGDPRDPQFCYARQVDYVSGASVMLPRHFLVQLGGFDSHFAPAYCEDSDLAMRIRSVGRTVMVQPQSQLVHYEGVTSGTDTGQGIKSYQIANTVKLFERWKDVLALRPANGVNPSDSKDYGLRRRLLVIDEITPSPDRDAGSVARFAIMQAAQSLGFQITFIPCSNYAEIPDYTARLQRIGVEALYAPYCTSVEQHLRDSGGRYDVILAYRGGLLHPLLDVIRNHAPQARLVYHTSELHHLREAHQAEIEDDHCLADQAKKIRERELMLVGAVDTTIVHSTYDKDYLTALLPGAQVEVFNSIIGRQGTNVLFEVRSGLMFLGDYNHYPNVDAVHWFLDEIWPRVAERLPDAVFNVVGSNIPEELRARAGGRVQMIGYVEDLRPIMDRCRMSVVPLRYGAGTKGELATSFAYGLPAVTTGIGAEGMGLGQGEAVFIADDVTDFADRIVQLYQDAGAWNRMSVSAMDYVENNFSREAGTEVVRCALLGNDGKANDG